MPNTMTHPGNDDTKVFIKAAQTKAAEQLFELLNIRDNAGHTRAVEMAGKLMDIIDDQADHPMIPFLEVLGDAIAHYEEKIYPPFSSSGVDALKYLMEANGLKQADLADIFGGQSVVSEILNGRRKLNNVDQIRKLAERFNVATSLFV